VAHRLGVGRRLLDGREEEVAEASHVRKRSYSVAAPALARSGSFGDRGAGDETGYNPKYGGVAMEIPKEAILKLIRERLGGDKAQEADQQLPDQVDPEKHSDLLSKFGINPEELLSGGLGSIAGKFGL
jgi:hypothetical protein